MSKLAPIGYYDKACRAVAKARSVDELRKIRIEAVAIEAAAKMAKNRSIEADAVAIRMRAVRHLNQLIETQKTTVGLARGAEHGGRRKKIDGVRKTPSIVRPTLAMQGIDKNLAKQARVLGALSDEKFEEVVANARDKANRAVRNAVREVEILQERESYRARVENGCTVDDLAALAASGYRAGVIYADVPSTFEVYNDKGNQTAAEHYYDTMTVDELKTMAPLIQALATKDCALLYWTSGPQNAAALAVIEAWGFDYKTWGFVWLKTNPSSGAPELEEIRASDLHTGTTFTTWPSTEVVLLAKRGAPMRLADDVRQVVIAPHPGPGHHSAKPEEVRRRIERLYPGPYLELFGRKPVPNWCVWGNEIERAELRADKRPYNAADDFAKSYDDCLHEVRERVGAGGKGWTPK